MRRQKLGDRMIVVIGALVVASVAALVGFAYLVASRVDENSATRELAVARGELIELAERMKAELATFTRWEEAVQRTAHTRDPAWIHRYLGLRLYHAGGHHRTYVLNQTDEPIYAAKDGVMVSPDAFRAIHEKVAPFVQSVRHAHAVDFAYRLSSSSASAGGIEPPAEPSVEVGFRRIEGRPALLGVMTIVPALRSSANHSSPSIAVSAAFLGGNSLTKLARELGTDNLTVTPEKPGGGRLALEVPLGAQEAPAWVAWSPRTPGTAMLNRLLPALATVVALLIGITALVLF